jgi:hypothetical protein
MRANAMPRFQVLSKRRAIARIRGGALEICPILRDSQAIAYNLTGPPATPGNRRDFLDVPPKEISCERRQNRPWP